MRPARKSWPAIALGLLLAAEPGRAQERESSYVISNYELTFELMDGRSDAHVTMDITYRIDSGSKSDGFKFIGNFEPRDLSGTEIGGPAMRMSVEHQRETRIVWQFTPTGRGEKRIRIDFSIADAVAGPRAQNTLRADWAGVFRVPIERARYRLVLPSDWTGERIVTTPTSFSRDTTRGRPTIDVEQAPLTETSFAATFSPGVIDRPLALLSSTRSRAGNSNAGPVLAGILAVGAVIFLIVVGATAKRGKRVGGRSTSSCAGGSSCSSSSCSSGCGGGGCGGGCGS
jgi:hypothetical protein